MIVVIDRYGKIVRGNFPSRVAAEAYRYSKGNRFWRIREIHTNENKENI